MRRFLSYGRQYIDDEDISAVSEVLRGDYLTQGPKIKEFEDALCAYTGARYCVALSNGTAALHLAVTALEIDQGCEGITSPITFVASANCMLYNGLIPVFADIDKRTYNIDPFEIEKNISDKTRLIIPVHFAGQACDMKRMGAMARERKLFIIEDAAHAIGSRYADGGRVGNCRYSDMTVFSFHPVKTMTTGEGGAVTTNDESLYKKLLLLRTHGITKAAADLTENPGPWYYEMHELGYNYRLTDMQAALGASQLKKLDRLIERRKELVRRYNSGFDDIEWLSVPFEAVPGSSAFHLYVLLIDFTKIGRSRKEVMEHLQGKGIGTQVHYIPVNRQPYYREHLKTDGKECPRANAYYEKALSIPLFPAMTDDEADYVIESIKGLHQ